MTGENKIKLDKWQMEVLNHNGNITIRAGRQVGKSTVIARKAAWFAKENPGTVTLVIAASQKQASWLFEKVRGEIDEIVDMGLIEYKEPPTKTRMKFTNGAEIHCLPAGRTGYFIRGLTLDLLICDEAAFIPEEVYRSITPMMAVSRKMRGFGWMILLSTPFGKGGFFYETHHDKDFRQWHVSSEKCPRLDVLFLKKEKERMTKAEYAQEYLGEFTDEWNQFFHTELIKECMTFIEWNTKKDYDALKSYYLGVDIARYGGSENAFVVAEVDRKNNIRIVKALTTVRMSIVDTIGRIIALDEVFRFKRVFIDDAGVGGGPTDVLIEKLGRKVIGINNAKRNIDKDGRTMGIMKEDLYSHTLMLMESKKIEIIDNLALMKSLKSIIYEYTSEKKIKISGNYSHLTEAMVRACWCLKDRGLRPFIVGF